MLYINFWKLDAVFIYMLQLHTKPAYDLIGNEPMYL